jgi:hypothetical protein
MRLLFMNVTGNERSYSSIVDQFKSRFEWIVFATSGTGWGFLDDLTELYCEHFDDSD